MGKTLTGIGLLLCLNLQAQHGEVPLSTLLDSAYVNRFSNYEKTIDLLSQAEELVHSGGVKKNALYLLRVYQTRIITNRYFFHPQLCRKDLVEGERFAEQFKAELGDDYLETKRNLTLFWAQFYFDIDDYEKAIVLFSESMTQWERLPRTPENCYYLYFISQYIAKVQGIKGELEASLNQYLASVTYYECAEKEYPPNYALVFRNIGQAYLAKKDYQHSRIFLDRAQDSLQIFWNHSREKSAPAATAIALLETVADYYRQVKEFDHALVTFQKTAAYLPYSKPFYGRYYLGLGEVYESLGKFELAKEYYRKAVDFFLESSGPKSSSISSSFLAVGRLCEKESDLDLAGDFYQKSVASLVLDFSPASQENPPLRNILSKKQLFVALQRKSRLLERLYKKKQELHLLKQAWEVNQLSMALIDSTANEFSLDKDKIILADQSYSAYEDGIRMAYQLFKQTGEEHYFMDYFALVDKSKGVVLLENLRLVNHFAGVNPEWLDQEKDLKSELLISEQSLFELELRKSNSHELASAREHYANTKRDYAALINKVKQQAPDYYRLRFDHQVISPGVIQEHLLKKGEALVEFFVGDSTLAIVGLSADHRYAEVRKLIPDFSLKVNRMRSLLTDVDKESSAEFQESAGNFYDFLMKDCLLQLGPDITSITIVPDGLLGYLPFEILVRNRKAAEVDYLGNTCAIHYANSATYLNEQLVKRNSKSKYFFAGFVSSEASQFGGQFTAALPGAQKEVASITRLLGSGFSVFDPATKNDFKTQARDYKIIHLAMHSLVNDENPMFSVMVFSPLAGDSSNENQLNAIELYSMQLNSELAVLSACNTGVGKVHRGEGIMSFARAFAYAGVPSAVISLWQVPDKATSRIMLSFYQNLKGGDSKDRALQKAKREFIRNYPHLAHPYYWSGFILTGNNEPIEFPISRLWLWACVILLMTFVITVVGRNKVLESRKKVHHRGAGQ